MCEAWSFHPGKPTVPLLPPQYQFSLSSLIFEPLFYLDWPSTQLTRSHTHTISLPFIIGNSGWYEIYKQWVRIPGELLKRDNLCGRSIFYCCLSLPLTWTVDIMARTSAAILWAWAWKESAKVGKLKERRSLGPWQLHGATPGPPMSGLYVRK